MRNISKGKNVQDMEDDGFRPRYQAGEPGDSPQAVLGIMRDARTTDELLKAEQPLAQARSSFVRWASRIRPAEIEAV